MRPENWTSLALAVSWTLRYPILGQATVTSKKPPTTEAPEAYRAPAEEPSVLYFMCTLRPGPSWLQAAGGLSPRLPDPSPDEAWGYATVNGLGSAWAQLWRDWRDRTALDTNWDFESTLYLYEVSTCPNMVSHYSQPELNRVYWALGGFRWSQVVRYAALNPGDDMDGPSWINNGEFNTDWTSFHTSGWQPELSGYGLDNPIWLDGDWTDRVPAAAMTRREQALLFVRGIMQNTQLRTLFDWRGDFPLVRVTDSALSVPLSEVGGRSMIESFQLDTLRLPEDVARTLREKGRLTGEVCRVISLAISLSVWMHMDHRPHRRAWRQTGVRDGDEEYCQAAKEQNQCISDAEAGDCRALSDAIGQIKAASLSNTRGYGTGGLPRTACSRLRKIRFILDMADEYGAGTYDEISARVGPSSSFIVADEPHTPSRGDSIQLEPSMKDVFPSETVAVNEIGRISISARRVNVFGDDWWKIKGVRLVGQCSDSLTTIQLDKFASLNRQVQGGSEWQTRTEVWAGPVWPEDWNVANYCTHLERVEVQVQLGSSLAAGTWDDIVVQVGRQELTMMKQPSAGTDSRMRVDLKQAFGTLDGVIPVTRPIKFSVFSVPDGRAIGDSWKLRGITFRARCQRSDKGYKVDKYAGVNVWRLRDEGKQGHFSGKISLSDWQEESRTAANYHEMPLSNWLKPRRSR
ncbi:heat-labile enterotoxin IIB, A chain [Ophiocordyceps camponoti-floridani]|uniref:Heat-labile enterotoxin IIB, A chain n=1 Tax=Ophiocordyceps camponoti-floridani TaxID=2030778 RepID=A0A8H4Q1R2_9HYPO|nr:heat-labile enterotoxin IIB, A chain [Ophiocordyceps camponoti-floridani]